MSQKTPVTKVDDFSRGVWVKPGVQIPLEQIQLSAIRAQGSGGQNVNKVSSAIHLRFDIPASSLPDEIKQSLLAKGDQRISKEGVLVLKAQEYRTQEQNKVAALERLQQIVKAASFKPKKRLATRPTRGSKERRLQKKSQRSNVKANRGKVSW